MKECPYLNGRVVLGGLLWNYRRRMKNLKSRMKWEGKGAVKVVRKGTFEEQEIDKGRWVEGDGGEFQIKW